MSSLSNVNTCLFSYDSNILILCLFRPSRRLVRAYSTLLYCTMRAREVVAIGGPTAEDHPDLFHLLQKMDDHGAPSTSGGPMANDGVGAGDEMIGTL